MNSFNEKTERLWRKGKCDRKLKKERIMEVDLPYGVEKITLDHIVYDYSYPYIRNGVEDGEEMANIKIFTGKNQWGEFKTLSLHNGKKWRDISESVGISAKDIIREPLKEHIALLYFRDTDDPDPWGPFIMSQFTLGCGRVIYLAEGWIWGEGEEYWVYDKSPYVYMYKKTRDFSEALEKYLELIKSESE